MRNTHLFHTIFVGIRFPLKLWAFHSRNKQAGNQSISIDMLLFKHKAVYTKHSLPFSKLVTYFRDKANARKGEAIWLTCPSSSWISSLDLQNQKRRTEMEARKVQEDFGFEMTQIEPSPRGWMTQEATVVYFWFLLLLGCLPVNPR